MERPCLCCNTPTHNPRFCSRSCSTTIANQTKPKRKSSRSWHDVQCAFCGKAFKKLLRAEAVPSYCAVSCAAKAYWKRQPAAVKRTLVCPCGKEFHSRDRRQRCCSTACGRHFANRRVGRAYNAYIVKWIGGESVREVNISGQINRHIRRYLFEKYGSKCTKCGWAQVHPLTGRVPLTVEHIDGDWRNNSEDNLTVLCPNCHSLTATFGSLNRGRGRPRRPAYAC